MRLREKIAIFMVAVLLTVVGFGLIASSSASLFKIGKTAGYEIVVQASIEAPQHAIRANG